MRLKAPKGMVGISVGGEQYDVDKKGYVTFPPNFNHDAIAGHGFRYPTDEEIAQDLRDAEADEQYAKDAEAAEAKRLQDEADAAAAEAEKAKGGA